MIMKVFFVALIFALAVRADVYMHNMRGSNNRLNEQNDNRNQNNRLFDSQNNNEGGYNVGDMDPTTGATTEAGQAPLHYYEGSKIRLEWTAQHGQNNENLNSNIVIQYMCENHANLPYGTLTALRDGTSTGAQTTVANSGDPAQGRHELAAYFTDCQGRDRNQGLFVADRTLDGNTAEFTRQNTNGADSGLECPEERDYYPYWHPSPWRDWAVLVSNVSMCAYYQAESENVKERNLCSVRSENNQDDCTAATGTWETYAANGSPAPECVELEPSRDNHLGNTLGGQFTGYNATIPMDAPAGSEQRCVMRLRYNISTGDYDSWNTFSESNGANSPITQNPTINFGAKDRVILVQLALNSDQYGRTFQDRSHTFYIKDQSLIPAGTGPDAGGSIINLNVRGRRGNIVQTYPAIEYDFVPNDVVVSPADRLHIQWTGSVTTPAGAGQGTESTDKSNIVCIASRSQHIPLAESDPACNLFATQAVKEAFATAGLTDPTTVQEELNNITPYYDGGLIQAGAGQPGQYHYMCTRNDSFSNRDQRGTILVVA